jgi:PKD repeat protein
MKNPVSLILLLGFTLVRVASASTYADDFPAALSNYVYGGWQGPFGDGTAGRLFPTADSTGIYMDATYNGYVWALRSSPEFSDADMTMRFVLPNRDNTEADWFGLWMLAHNPITPPGGSCTTVCPFVVPESGLWLQFRVGFNQLVVTRFAGGVAASSTTVPLPLVALNQPHDARAIYQGGSLIVYLDSVQLLNWPAPDVPAGQVGFEVYRTDMIVDATNVVSGPGPPILAAIADMTVAPGATADQTISATDPDADAITFTSSGSSFMTLTQNAQVGNTRTGNIHLAPSLGTSGTFQASVTATANGQFDDQTFGITVHANGPPTLNQPADMTADEGATADQVLTGTDPDGDALTFTKVAGPTFMTVTNTNATTGNVHLAPGFADAGNDAATVRASDGSLSVDKSFAITVNNVPAPPVLANIADVTVAPGSTADRGISATDPDGDAITFTSSGPAFMTVTSNAQVGNTRTGNIHLAPGFSNAGTFPASVTATANGQFDDQGFVITVSNNGAPVLAQPANMTVSEGATADQILAATDPDGDALTFSKVSGPTFMTVTTTTITPPRGNVHLAPGFSDFGSSAAVVSVSDGTLTDSKSFTVTIGQCHGNPTLFQPANMTVAEGATADQVITGTDACGDALTFSKVAGPTFMTVTTTTPGAGTATGNIHLAPGFSDAGIYAATVRASDGILNSDKSLTATVVSVNRPPSLSQPAPMTLSEGATADQVIAATDPEGDLLTFSKVSGPIFMLVTTTTTNPPRGNVHLAPGFADAGAYLGTIRVSDGWLTDTKSFTITVNEGANRCPVSTPGGPYSGLGGAAVSFNGSASFDPDGTPLTYAWDFDASDGVGVDATGPTPVHTYAAGGTFTVTLAVSDGTCSSSSTTAANILPFCPATVFNGYDVIRIGSGRPTWFAFVQPASGCYVNTDVVLSSFVLSYAGRQIPADVTKSTIDSDKSGDGIQEIRVSFSKGNLRTLFSGTGLGNGHNLVTVMIEANLATGGALQGTTQVDVFNNGSFTAATVAPNPLNPATTLTFTTSRAGFARVELYDVAGRLVRTILDERSFAAGIHDVRIDGLGSRGETLASGIYFIRGASTEGEFTRTIAILK